MRSYVLIAHKLCDITVVFRVNGEVVLRPITFRSDWSYFMNFRLIVLIKVVAASKFLSDWSYKSHFRKNDLLQSSRNFRLKKFRVIGLIAVIPAQNFFENILPHFWPRYSRLKRIILKSLPWSLFFDGCGRNG